MNIHDVSERGTSPPDQLYASSGSLSSSVSLSDRSASTDCVEEFIGDMPFAGEFVVYFFSFFKFIIYLLSFHFNFESLNIPPFLLKQKQNNDIITD